MSRREFRPWNSTSPPIDILDLGLLPLFPFQPKVFALDLATCLGEALLEVVEEEEEGIPEAVGIPDLS